MRKLCFVSRFTLLLPLLVACLLSAFTLSAQIRSFEQVAGGTTYEKAEWNIRLNAAFANPHDQAEIALDLVLTSPSGLPLVQPCYFDSGSILTMNETSAGGAGVKPATGSAARAASVVAPGLTTASTLSRWKARFTPQEPGEYTYFFRLKHTQRGNNVSNSPGNAGAGQGSIVTIDSRLGAFTVVASASNLKNRGFLHKRDDWTFQFDNGELFRGVGENVGWESRSFENDRWTYEHLLGNLSKAKGNFFRTWMCSWNLPLEWKQVGSTKRYQSSNETYHPGGIERMDQLVNLCDSLDLYFMLSIDWHGALMEEGGQWSRNVYNVKNGGPAITPTDFFRLRSARDQYKNRLRYIIARWGYSPRVAVWEFFNEVDNAVFNAKDSVLIQHEYVTQWHDEMSRYLKELDPYKHLVSTSVSHREIIGMNSLAHLDFNQKHIYKHTERIPAMYDDYIRGFGKPYVIGEFGYRWEDDDPAYGEGFDYDFKRGLWYGLFQPTPILPMSWWWELFDTRQMIPYIEGVRMISEHMLKSGAGSFSKVDLETIDPLVEHYAVQCGNTIYIYLLNNSSVARDAGIKTLPGLKNAKVTRFDPATRQYGPLTNTRLAPREERILIFETAGNPIKRQH